MTAIRMINAMKSTAPKDAATIITEGGELLLSSMMTLSVDIASSVDFASCVDFAVVGVETVVEDPRIKALIIDIKPSFIYPK